MVAPQPAPAAASSAGQSRPANAAELSLVQTLMRETEELRGLRFVAPVVVTIEDRVAMRRYVERALDDVQLARATRRYLALGAIAPGLDVRGVLVSVMEEELVGYYDPKEKRLAVRSDIARALGSETSPASTGQLGRSISWRATVVHELVHALQDQHFALGDHIADTRSTDADNAFGALVEGDATLVMLGYTAQLSGETLPSLAQHPERILSAMSRSPEQLTPALRHAPALLREPLLFRYREGAHFCAELFRSGGWASIDAAHRAPPASTLSVRQPRRYLARTMEPTVPLPRLDWLEAQGYRRVDEDVLGGLELSIVLDTAGADAEYIASAWRGDRYVVLERGQADASIWWLRFSSASIARNVATAFARMRDPDRRITRKGAALLVTRGVEDSTFATAASKLEAVAPAARRAPKTALRSDPFALNRGDRLATNAHEH